MEIRKGIQTPSQSYVLPYKQTKGQEAIDLYNSTGRTAQEWQELLLYDLLAINDENLYVHTKYGYSVPRRNGKNEVVVMREMWGLVNGQRILHTAHRTTTTHVAWERLYDLLEKANIEIVSSYRAYGKEHIKIKDGGTIEFRTRTSKGGLGEGFDLLVIDEAQEYQDDQESALKYVVSDSLNPQTLFCGTPPTTTSSGTVFTKLRDNTLKGKVPNAGWAEWSVENQTDPNNREAWYIANPSLGTILTERKIQDEIGNDIIDFNIQRLGLWIKYSLKSEISKAEWLNLKVNSKPTFKGRLFCGVKFGRDGQNVALSIAVKTSDERIYVECINLKPIREGDDWLLKFLSNKNIEKVVIDGASGQKILVDELKTLGIKNYVLPSVGEIITANSLFEKGLNGTIAHNDQPTFTSVVTNCEKRAIGTNGGFGYKSLNATNDISIMDSAILAYWICSITKEKKKQKISY